MTIAAESATASHIPASPATGPRIPAESATRSANRGKHGDRLHGIARHHIARRPTASLQATHRACAGRLRPRFLTNGKNGNRLCRSFISVALRALHALRVEPSYSGKNGNQENDMARAKTWPLLATHLRGHREKERAHTKSRPFLATHRYWPSENERVYTNTWPLLAMFECRVPHLPAGEGAGVRSLLFLRASSCSLCSLW